VRRPAAAPRYPRVLIPSSPLPQTLLPARLTRASQLVCSCSLAEVFLGSISDVLKRGLGLDCAELDHELHKLQLYVKNVYIARQWFSHDFSISVQECLDAVSSLAELCSLMQRRLADAALAADFKACVEGLKACTEAIDSLQADVSDRGDIPFRLRAEHVAAIILLRSFERLCAAAEENGSKLSCVSSHRNAATGSMHYTDVMHVVDDMQRHHRAEPDEPCSCNRPPRHIVAARPVFGRILAQAARLRVRLSREEAAEVLRR